MMLDLLDAGRGSSCEVQELTKAAAAGAVGPLADRIVDLSNRLGVTQGAALSMLRILGEHSGVSASGRAGRRG